MLTKKCDVKIHKGALTVIPKTIYDHEVKLLEVLYGQGAVVRYERKELYTPPKQSYVEEGELIKYSVEDVDYDDEYSRLFMVYGNHPTINLPLVEHCYGDQDGRKLESINNEKYDGESVEVASDNVVDEGESPVDSEKVLEEKNEYTEMTKMQLKRLLNERDVDYSHNATKTALIKLLEDGDN